MHMYIPLSIRLTFFYTLILGVALCFFGYFTYTQAAQRAYQELDNTLSSRAASVRLGKDMLALDSDPSGLPLFLSSVDGLGTGGVAIEILEVQNSHFTLIATTTDTAPDYLTGINSSVSTSPIPWDRAAALAMLHNPTMPASSFSTITYAGQRVRIFTTTNKFSYDSHIHIIQTAHSYADVEQSLSILRNSLLLGGGLILLVAMLVGWLITRSVLIIVQRMSKTAEEISHSHDLSRRVPHRTLLGSDELAELAGTLNHMLASLQEAARKQQRFVADASHELRAPITSIRCNLDLLARAPDLPSEEVQAMLTDARAEAARMGRLVNDLLLLAHTDGSERESNVPGNEYKKDIFQEIDLDSLVLEVFRQYCPTPADSEPSHRPRLVLQHIAPVKVYGDADRLKQAIVALVDNALKYTPSEGCVSLSLTTDETSAMLKVSDSGIGISPADLPHIFERFYRADRAHSRNRGGSGLGLAIAQSIVQEHNGSITVDSSPGKGSTFAISLPLK